MVEPKARVLTVWAFLQKSARTVVWKCQWGTRRPLQLKNMKLRKFSLRKLYRKLYLQERTSILQMGTEYSQPFLSAGANQPWSESRWLNIGMWNVWIFRAGPWFLTTLYKGSRHPGILVSMEVLALIIADTEGDYIMDLPELNAIVNMEMPAI